MAELLQHWTLTPTGAGIPPAHLVDGDTTLCGAAVGPRNGPEFVVNSARMCIECAARSLELQAAELRAKGRIDV